MQERHVLLASCRRPINIAMEVGVAGLTNDHILFHFDRHSSGDLQGVSECAERGSHGGSGSHPQKRSPCYMRIV